MMSGSQVKILSGALQKVLDEKKRLDLLCKEQSSQIIVLVRAFEGTSCVLVCVCVSVFMYKHHPSRLQMRKQAMNVK
jgi:hypothetical protein